MTSTSYLFLENYESKISKTILFIYRHNTTLSQFQIEWPSKVSFNLPFPSVGCDKFIILKLICARFSFLLLIVVFSCLCTIFLAFQVFYSCYIIYTNVFTILKKILLVAFFDFISICMLQILQDYSRFINKIYKFFLFVLVS